MLSPIGTDPMSKKKAVWAARLGSSALTSESSSCDTIEDTSCGGSSKSNGDGNLYYARTFDSNGYVVSNIYGLSNITEPSTHKLIFRSTTGAIAIFRTGLIVEMLTD